MADRPMVSVYEPDADGVEQLVYRPMNDEEFAQWEADVATFQAEQAASPANPVLQAVRSMTPEERKELLALVTEEA